MRDLLSAFAVLLVCGVLVGGCKQEVVEIDDMDALQGTWVGKEIDGREGEWTFVIMGDEIDATGPDPESYTGTIMLNSDVDPKQADFTIVTCEFEQFVDKTSLGLYSLADGKFVLAANKPGSEIRPLEISGGGITRMFEFTKQPR